jgi:hypothetical protein
MQHLEGSGTAVLYIGLTVPKGYTKEPSKFSVHFISNRLVTRAFERSVTDTAVWFGRFDLRNAKISSLNRKLGR